jgi:hypothetical protein
MKLPKRLAFLLFVPLLFSCSRGPAQSVAAQAVPYNPPPVIAWLDCVECTSELKAVAALGDAAVPDLRSVLLNGPPSDRQAQQRAHAEAAYKAMKEYERQHPDRRVATTEQEYVDLQMRKYVNVNRVRSARALGEIATDAAKNALREAQQLKDLTPDLTRTINVGLGLAPPSR